MKKRTIVFSLLFVFCVLGLLSACGNKYAADKIEEKMTFSGDTVTYDGESHPLSYEGTLLEGLTASYSEENNATEVGTHEVTITLVNKKGEEVYAASVSLVIVPRPVSLAWSAPKNLVYDGTAKAPKAVVANLAGSDQCQVSVAVLAGMDDVNVGSFSYKATSLSNKNYTLEKGEYVTSPSYMITRGTYDLSGISFDDASVTYDGESHPLAISGTLPEGVTVSYSENNQSTDAGTYTVTATFKGTDNYEAIASKSATLVIEKATHDMSGISFDDASVTYDGESHSLAISGTLPEGVTVTYSENNQSTDAGTYAVTATFKGTDNYEAIASMSARLVINPRPATLSWSAPQDLVYSGKAKTPSVKVANLVEGDECMVTSSLSEGSDDVNVGSFTYKATSLSNPNYTLSGVNVTSEAYSITKATYDMSGITFANGNAIYDGASHPLAIAGSLPEGVSLVYSEENQSTAAGNYAITASFVGSTNYHDIVSMSSFLTISPRPVTLSWISPLSLVYSGSAKETSASITNLVGSDACSVGVMLTEGNDNVNVGSFTYTAMSLSNANYTLIGAVVTSEAFTITQATYDMSGITLDSSSVTYDGVSHPLAIAGTLPDGVTVTYSENNQSTDAGTYSVTASFTGSTNYNAITSLTADLVIERATYDMSGITLVASSVTYDGVSHPLAVSGTLPSGVTVSYSENNQSTDAGTYNVTASFTGSTNYNAIASLTADLVIAKATYDMSGITFTGKTAIQDGSSHPLAIAGTLPEGVTVSYSAENTRTDAGDHVVTASFQGSTNYNAIASLTATLKIVLVSLEENITDAGTLTKEVSATTITLAAKTYLGYTWLGWYQEETLVTSDLMHTFDYPSADVAYTGKWEADSDLSDFTFISGPETLIITKYNGTATTVTIPNTVTEIGASAFSSKSTLQTLAWESPSKVVKIRSGAFQYCSSLSTPALPDSVIIIEPGAFNNTSWYNAQADGAVYAGKVLYDYKGTMPASFTLSITDGTIGITSGVFKNETNLTSVTVPSSLEYIGSDAFTGTAWYDALADGFVTIGSVLYAYKGTAPSDATYDVSSGITMIGDGVFKNWQSLTSISLPTGLLAIGNNAFNGASVLATCEIPSSLIELGGGVFTSCFKLTSLVIPEGVTKIDSDTFKSCMRLETITLPTVATSLGASAFNGCSKLKNVVIPKGVKTLTGGYNSTSNQYEGAFMNCSALMSITIPSGVTSIGDSAFWGCSGLTSITIPSGVTSIGAYAFFVCSGLKSITIPSGVTSIGDRAFTGCSGLTSITIPDSMTSIGYRAFYECSGLTSITIPSSVTSIGDRAFYGCSSLTSITIPSSITSIGQSAFQGCRGLTNITFADTSTWYATDSYTYTGGSVIDVTNPATNATTFKQWYSNYLYKN